MALAGRTSSNGEVLQKARAQLQLGRTLTEKHILEIDGGPEGMLLGAGHLPRLPVVLGTRIPDGEDGQ